MTVAHTVQSTGRAYYSLRGRVAEAVGQRVATGGLRSMLFPPEMNGSSTQSNNITHKVQDEYQENNTLLPVPSLQTVVGTISIIHYKQL